MDINMSPRWSHRRTSTTGGSDAFHAKSIVGCCACNAVILIGVCVLFARLFALLRYGSNLDVFIDSISVSSAGGSGTPPVEWYVRFQLKTPITGLTFKFNILYARLFRQEKILSTATIESLRQEFIDYRPVATAAFFNTTALEAVGNDRDVVWDFRIEAVAGLQGKYRHQRSGYIYINCGELPVWFWSEPAAATAVKGSLLGKMKRCLCTFLEELDPSLFDSNSTKWH